MPTSLWCWLVAVVTSHLAAVGSQRVREARIGRHGQAVSVADGFLDGIELASPEVAETIRRKARKYAGWRRPPIVVSPEDFVPLEDANARVQSRLAPWPTINVLTARGYVQRCFRASDAEEGVTGESLAAEVEWRRSATWRHHVKRLLRAVDESAP